MPHLLKHLVTALLGLALVVAPIMATPAHAAPEEANVYTTPGGHFTNGRYWFTDCEMYSSDIVRCRTSIWSFHVDYTNGAYHRVEGWTFNNLTYLPSRRSAWSTNNLGHDAEWSSGGRTWRTECDTALTGQGGCRSFVWTKQAKAVAVVDQWGNTTGYRFEPYEGWVFNNIVLFSSRAVPAVTTIPTYVLDRSMLGWDGFGPLKLGAVFARMIDMGYMTSVRGPADCGRLSNTPTLVGRGLRINAFASFPDNTVAEVHLTTPFGSTVDGARVGMTIGQVRGIYGSRFNVVALENYSAVPGGPDYGVVLQVGRVVQQDKELLFVVDERSPRRITDADTVTRIILREKSSQLSSLCSPGDYWDPSGDPGFGGGVSNP